MAYQEIDISTIYKREQLYKSLCIPSSIHSFSLSVEYMRNWFITKFSKDYFKTVYIDNKHVFDDFRQMTQAEQLKRLKPSLAIIPQIDLTFDRERIDSYPFGLEIYTSRSKRDDAFLKDRSKHIYVGISMKADLVNFNFKVRLSTKAQQLDMFNYMKMAFRVGYTQGEDVDMDFHVPYNLMIQMAKDSGYEAVDNKIKNPIGFLNYLNTHSTIPFLYKFRCINGHDEFFIRMSDLYVHISTPDILADDGEREGHLSNNFVIELQASVRFPSPQFYVYYSETKNTEIESIKEIDDVISVFSVQIVDIPEINEKKWNQYLTTEYNEKDLSKPLVIDFSEFFTGDLGEVIKYNNSIFISSDIFIELKLYNDGKIIEADIDWDTMTLTTRTIPVDITTFIAIYVDLLYMNKYVINNDNSKDNRIN